MAKKEQCTKFKKAPQAPRRFKSAYMFYSTTKHKSIRKEDHGKKLQTTDVAKMVAQAWKNLPPDEREEWEEMARRDKARYELEKTMYTGPWKVPATKARSQKDPNAPKRPMSAFLSYSNSKRAHVKSSNPDIGNAEVSRVLAKMWKEAPEEERRIHIEKEFELRQRYKSAIAIWRQNADEELKAVRKKREDIALQRLDSPENFMPGSAVLARRHIPMEDHGGAPPEVSPDSHPKSSLLRSADGPPPSAACASMRPFGVGFNDVPGDDYGSPHTSSQQYGYYAPQPQPPPHNGFGDARGGAPMPPTGGMEGPGDAYGMVHGGGKYQESYPGDYGVPSNGFEHGYTANASGFYGTYPSQAPPQMHMSQHEPNGMAWDGQYYGHHSGQPSPSAPDGPSGYGYGCY